jgi:hypothetical protein
MQQFHSSIFNSRSTLAVTSEDMIVVEKARVPVPPPLGEQTNCGLMATDRYCPSPTWRGFHTKRDDGGRFSASYHNDGSVEVCDASSRMDVRSSGCCGLTQADAPRVDGAALDRLKASTLEGSGAPTRDDKGRRDERPMRHLDHRRHVPQLDLFRPDAPTPE